jgi:hypothetical protein
VMTSPLRLLSSLALQKSGTSMQCVVDELFFFNLIQTNFNYLIFFTYMIFILNLMLDFMNYVKLLKKNY